MKELISLIQNLTAAGIDPVVWALVAMLPFALLLHYLPKHLPALYQIWMDYQGKRFHAAQQLFEILRRNEDLLVEEAFNATYGFILATEEIKSVLRRKNPLQMVLALRRGRRLVKFRASDSTYSYEKKIPLSIRRHTSCFIYWASAMLVYFVLIVAVLGRQPVLFLFGPIFFLTAWSALSDYGRLDCARGLIDPLRFPWKEDFPKIGTEY